MNQQRYVAYFRVSTQKQGRSGLGMEAQHRAVDDFIKQYGGLIVASFQEIESGKRSDRKEFNRALDYAELYGATLLVAKIDRLTRDLHFLTGLQKRGLNFKFCDMPQVDKLTVHLMTAVAENELRLISSRTKSALKEAKARGTILGNPYLDIQRNRDVSSANKARSTAQVSWKIKILKIISHLKTEGITTCQALANEMNHRGLRTQRGCMFSVATISRLRRKKSDG